MLTAPEARTVILAARCCVVYFTKADGTRRRMVCHVPSPDDPRAFTSKANHLIVWDVEKGEPRTVNLATVERIKALKVRTYAGKSAAVRELLRKYNTAEKISALFAY